MRIPKMTSSSSSPERSASSTPESAAALELTILSISGHSSSSCISVWLDPAHKRRARSLSTIHLPLSLLALQNPNSSLTIQILSHGRLPFRYARPYAAADVALSSLPLAGGNVAADLRRPSGRIAGIVRFSVRLLWSLNPEPISDCFESESDLRLEPSAPPLGLIDETERQEGKTALNNNMEWKSFLVGMFSGAMAVALIAALKPH